MNNEQRKIIGYDSQTGQPIYEQPVVNQQNVVQPQLTEKELKKANKKVVSKAANMIGTAYFLMLGAIWVLVVLILAPTFKFYFNLSKTTFTIVFGFLYAVLPILGAIILDKTLIKKISKNVTSMNYKRVENIVVQQLIILGIMYFIGYYNLIMSIIVISGYVFASILIVKSLRKHCKIS